MNKPKSPSERLVDYYSSKSVIQNLPQTNCKECNAIILEPYETCLDCDQLADELYKEKVRTEFDEDTEKDDWKWSEAERYNDDPDNYNHGSGDDV